MSQSAKLQEPSMEEILASIRRIIADDDATKGAKAPEPAAKPVVAAPAPLHAAALPPAPPPPALANSQDDVDAMLANVDPPAPAGTADVLDLTEAMTAPGAATDKEAAATFRTIDASSDVVFTERPANAQMESGLRVIEERRAPPPQPAPPPAAAPLPPQAAPALDRGLISKSTMAAVDSAFNSLANTVLGQNARTLEALVKEMLRPMLKSWLDDNLPGLVERIVRAEIERVSRGRG
jgi:cell pole-organizing protein PopZ